MRVLVTGSSGHVGGAIARRLVSAGHDVVGVSRSVNPELPVEIAQHVIPIGDAEFLHRARAIARCEAVIHAAALIEPGDDPEELARVNCVGTDQVLALARGWDAGRFVFISSIAVEGLPQVLPMTEDHPLSPMSPYAASKLYGECAVAASGLCGTSLRITSPVGPGLRRRRIFSIFVERALSGAPIVVGGEGTRRQNYVDVRDIAEAVVQLLTAPAEGVYHVAGAKSVSNLELAQACVSVLGSESEVSCDGKADPQEGLAWEVSSGRASEAFGYVAAYTMEDSIRDLGAELNV